MRRNIVLLATAVAALAVAVGSATAGWQGLSDLAYFSYDDPGHVCTNGIEFGAAYPFGQAGNLAVRGDRGHIDTTANSCRRGDRSADDDRAAHTVRPRPRDRGTQGHWFEFFRLAWTAPVAAGSPIQLHLSGPSNIFPQDTIESRGMRVALVAVHGLRPAGRQPPTPNRMKAGRTVPVKFSLGGDRGLDIFESGYPHVRSIVPVGVGRRGGGNAHGGAEPPQLFVRRQSVHVPLEDG